MPVTIESIVIFATPTHTRAQLLEPVLDQVRLQESELLPFDEPRHEVGQQDGSLRPEWERAYNRGQPFYSFNDDKYPTFFKGKPFVPQVCADFIVDTIDRTAGTWYAPSLRHPARSSGRFDLRQSVKSRGLDPRRLNELIDYVKQETDSFHVIFEGTGPRTSETKKLKKWMKNLDVQVGDIIIFRGKVPWDNKEEHNHSMFVTGLDNNGQVQLVVGNPVWPIERSLAIEGNRTPKRHVVFIFRMTDTFLRQITGLDDE